MKNFKTKINFISLFVLMCFCSIGVKLFQVQIIRHEFFSRLVSLKVDRVKKSQAMRGIIFDSNKRPLATAMAVESCYAEPKKAKNNINIDSLAKCLDMPADSVAAKISENKKSVLLKKYLYPDDVEKIKTARIPRKKLNLLQSGIYFEKKQLRRYPEGSLANYVVGIVGADNNGQAGVECTFDKFLTGNSTKYITSIDGKGRETVTSKMSEEERAVVLTIDSSIQYVVEREIKKAYQDTNANLVTCIVQNPQTGEILAMASYPSFNPNVEHKRNPKMFKNPAIGNSYEPGSVYKIVAAATALENNPDVYKEKFYCEQGEYRLSNDVTIHDSEHKYGSLSFEEILAYSSNIGFAKLSKSIGARKLWQYSRAFGFGSKSGIELPGEESGLLKPPEKWSGISTEMISFGQEISVTPLQIVNSYSVIANGGFLMEPRIVKSLLCNGIEQKVYEPVVIRRVISQHTVSKLTEMLEAVVNYGTGDNAKLSGIRVAGKTGTAQKYDSELRRYSAKKYVSSFVGFFPAENPKATVIVLVDEPKGEYYAASVAAPVFKRIAGSILEYLNVHPVTEIASKQNL